MSTQLNATGVTFPNGTTQSVAGYPNTNPSGFTSNAGTVTSISAGTGISVSGTTAVTVSAVATGCVYNGAQYEAFANVTNGNPGNYDVPANYVQTGFRQEFIDDGTNRYLNYIRCYLLKTF